MLVKRLRSFPFSNEQKAQFVGLSHTAFDAYDAFMCPDLQPKIYNERKTKLQAKLADSTGEVSFQVENYYKRIQLKLNF